MPNKWRLPASSCPCPPMNRLATIDGEWTGCCDMVLGITLRLNAPNRCRNTLAMVNPTHSPRKFLYSIASIYFAPHSVIAHEPQKHRRKTQDYNLKVRLLPTPWLSTSALIASKLIPVQTKLLNGQQSAKPKNPFFLCTWAPSCSLGCSEKLQIKGRTLVRGEWCFGVINGRSGESKAGEWVSENCVTTLICQGMIGWAALVC